MADVPLHPPTIIYGCKPPTIRLRWRGGTQTYFCINNENLHLDDSNFYEGTYEMGDFLGKLCREHCTPKRNRFEPCPALVESYKVGTENEGLATVKMHPVPKWRRCAGVEKLLELMQTPEERFFFEAYLEDKFSDESTWRDGLVKQWNEGWHRVPNGWGEKSRRGKFDQMLWWTLRFPALIPQVWLNWLSAAPEEELKALDENPSRVDFVSFWNYDRHLIEIDGPSHYAEYDESAHAYRIDERAYARNLKIARSLAREGWVLTRIARIEVRDVMDDEIARFMGFIDLLSVVPFHKNEGYPEQLGPSNLGLPELVESFAWSAADDDIPF